MPSPTEPEAWYRADHQPQFGEVWLWAPAGIARRITLMMISRDDGMLERWLAWRLTTDGHTAVPTHAVVQDPVQRGWYIRG